MHARPRLAPSVLLLALVASAPERAAAFTVELHRAITDEALREVVVEIDGEPTGFGERALAGIVAANAQTDVGRSAIAARPDKHFADEQIAAGSRLLIESKSAIVDALTARPRSGENARALLGEALHTLQDFYAHTSWVELGNADIAEDLGRRELSDPDASLAACPADPSVLDGSGMLTSGYFSPPAEEDPLGCGSVPQGKCDHGGLVEGCPGISKDVEDPDDPSFAAARALAVAASIDFVEQILEALADDPGALAALLEVRGTVGFVIDDTGSMGEEIDGVKFVVGEIVDEIVRSSRTQPDAWLLERFGDPDVGPAAVFSTARQLLDAVGALIATGGGDCDELSQTALLDAIEAAAPGSRLFFFSDAGAKDAALANAVISSAQAKSIAIFFLLTGTCTGSIDGAYGRAAPETGGQLFSLSSTEVARLGALVKPAIDGDLVTLGSSGGAGGRSLDIPVDDTVRRLVVAASGSGGGPVSLRRPSGEAVDLSDPSQASVATLSSGSIVTVPDPTPGTWRFESSGGASGSVVAFGNSPIDFRRFEFVEPNADVHGGFVAIPGQPVAGGRALARATLLGPFASGRFRLVDEAGAPLREIDLQRGFPGAGEDVFVGELDLPSRPFRVVAEGEDVAGFAYRREFPAVFRAQRVRVELLEPDDPALPIGATTLVQARVTNLGRTATFRIEAASSSAFPTSAMPSVLTLARGAAATVDVAITPPVGTAVGAPVTLTVTATKADDSTAFNSASLGLETAVGPLGPGDGRNRTIRPRLRPLLPGTR